MSMHHLLNYLRRKWLFLTLMTIMIIANVIVWSDIFRGCTTPVLRSKQKFAQTMPLALSATPTKAKNRL